MGALEELRLCAETMIHKYMPEDLPPKGKLYYHQGVFLMGLLELWKLTNEDKYIRYVQAYLDSVLDEHGLPRLPQPGELDDVMAGNLLFSVWQTTKQDRYRLAIEYLYRHLLNIPRTREGAPWHKTKLPGEMWLDGLYMADPFLATYGEYFHCTDAFELAKTHIRIMLTHTRDEESGLYRHAWDESRRAAWADPVSGQSPENWGRSVGWAAYGLLNTLDHLPPNDSFTAYLKDVVQKLLLSVCKYQSEEGRWFQVLDKGTDEGNWLENSCSCLFTASIFKSMRLHILDRTFTDRAQKAYEAIVRSCVHRDGMIEVGQVCVGTNVGNYAHYIARPVSINDLHGVGAYQLMCAEKVIFDRGEDHKS